MFDTVLIANRGEIACRVIRTCRRLGIATVAVYSEADAGALHVEMADRAVPIGPAPARDSYLRGDAVIAAARATGAQAIHPGYGFLSENAAFAEAVADAGLTFIGPPPAAIRAMGSKSAAKALMQAAGVPLVPGYHGDDQDPARLAAEATRVGFPLLIKASAGGGGKGMRIVRDAAAFAEALAGAQREAAAAFGDTHVLLERYLPRARHIEVQVFADSHGTCLHLHERDCSIQRRHQKVVEEAPAPGLDAARRAEMGAAAVAAAEAVGYRGAGTVEFIAEVPEPGGPPGGFFFMEMNTRLQVEHPVTEAITGLDLVEWQLRVAAGAPLPLTQAEIPLRGHAIEVRLYAEDPARDYLPSTGRLALLELPPETAGGAAHGAAEGEANGERSVRIDGGVHQGDLVTSHYDPMIAKLIVHGPDRPAAVRALRAALAETAVAGPETNRDALAAIAADPDFAAGRVDTGFLDRRPGLVTGAVEQTGGASGAGLPPDAVLARFCLAELLWRRRDAAAAADASADPHSPWHRTDGWRLNDRGGGSLSFEAVAPDGTATRCDIAVTYLPAAAGDGRTQPWPRYRLALPGGDIEVSGRLDGSHLTIESPQGRDSARYAAWTDGQGRPWRAVIGPRRSWRLVRHDPLARAAAHDGAAGSVRAPMPGKVTALHVAEGDRVARGTPLLVIEAMKMEHTLTAPEDGTVASLRCALGDQVEEGAELVAVSAGD